MMVAALYVSPSGPYWGRTDVDAWDLARDARQYAGPHPVVAHPPCARWCQLAHLVQSVYGHPVGDDNGCFAAALRAVRQWGGVLEHPAWSLAWRTYGIIAPTSPGWQRTIDGEWVGRVRQTPYGHRARKETWLLYVGDVPPLALDLSRPPHTAVVSGAHNRCRASDRVWPDEAARTPTAFAELLIALARGSRCSPAPRTARA